jgi:hypothetical protein
LDFQLIKYTGHKITPLEFLALPPELHLKIFSFLDTTASVCLGVTCRYFYSLHVRLHGKIYLNFFDTPQLPSLLRDWMGSDYAFYRKNFRFVHRSLVEEMRSKEREYWEGYFQRMEILPMTRRVELLERVMDVWERGLGVNA